MEKIQYQECESNRIGALKADELISIYGKAALLTLAGKGIKLDDASEILKKESAVNKHLVELIIESEKEVLKQRFYRRKTEKAK